MKLIQRFLFVLFLLLTCCQLMAQESPQQAPIDLLLERLDKHQRLQPQEKLFLHVEKEVHEGGEHLWFKIYLLAGAQHRPSPISTGAFVELIAPDGRSLRKSYVKVNRGLGYGDMEITTDMPAGSYRVKAYTQWMKNFDWDYIPETRVGLGKSDSTLPATNQDCQASFFPEGGQWVAGLPQRLAIQAEHGQAINGSIQTKGGEVLATFSTDARGLAVVDLEMDADAEPRAFIEGCHRAIALPRIVPTGTVMKVSKMGTQFIRVDIETNKEEDESLLHALIQSRGVVANRLDIQVNGGRARAIIPVKDLPSGIVQISLFNEQLALLSERLVYADPQNQLEVTSQVSAADRTDWFNAQLNLKEATKGLVNGHFSVALFAAQAPEPTQRIDTYMSLEAELPKVNDALSYFDHDTRKALPELDLLLMTQKWNWITWKNLMLNRITATDKPLNTYMNDAYIERQKFKEDEEAIANLDANARRLDDVVVTAKREEVEANTTVPKVYGRGDGGTLDLDEVQINNNERVIDILRGRFAGVVVSGNEYETSINIRSSVTGTGASYAALEPLILLNNMPTDVASILDIQARFVKSIEIFKGSQASIFGMRGAGGAVAIYTRNEPVMNPGAGPDAEEPEGPEAEVPKVYEKPTAFEPRPGAKSGGLIYWNPLLTTDDQGNISFSFKKPEGFSGNVFMHIQGVDINGVPYSLVQELK